MALPLIGFLSIENGTYFPVAEQNRFAIEYMMKNPDTFARKYDESMIPAGEFNAPKPIEQVYSKEELEAMLLVELKRICKDRRITVGEADKAGVVELILADQDERA